jgi:hypothetical protein
MQHMAGPYGWVGCFIFEAAARHFRWFPNHRNYRCAAAKPTLMGQTLHFCDVRDVSAFNPIAPAPRSLMVRKISRIEHNTNSMSLHNLGDTAIGEPLIP